jgi:H2-forming N5,N10-methylenetetrahydromethanopterin dehydrogenase-like enzyme
MCHQFVFLFILLNQDFILIQPHHLCDDEYLLKVVSIVYLGEQRNISRILTFLNHHKLCRSYTSTKMTEKRQQINDIYMMA